MSGVIRVLRWYDKNTEEYVGEAILEKLDLRDLQHVMGSDKNDPMYYCYPVYSEEGKLLHIDELNLDLYEYFIEANSIEEY